MHGDLEANLVAGGRGESVFDSISRCITFDRQNFGKDVEIFERAREYVDDVIDARKKGNGAYCGCLVVLEVPVVTAVSLLVQMMLENVCIRPPKVTAMKKSMQNLGFKKREMMCRPKTPLSAPMLLERGTGSKCLDLPLLLL